MSNSTACHTRTHLELRRLPFDAASGVTRALRRSLAWTSLNEAGRERQTSSLPRSYLRRGRGHRALPSRDDRPASNGIVAWALRSRSSAVSVFPSCLLPPQSSSASEHISCGPIQTHPIDITTYIPQHGAPPAVERDSARPERCPPRAGSPRRFVLVCP